LITFSSNITETDLTSYWKSVIWWIRYNTNQSEIAIGSGGWLGKDSSRAHKPKEFVPEQHTDYIFTTVGEEWGFAGSLVVMALFAGLLLRIIYLAERQKQNSVVLCGILFTTSL
jgi:rod shape determining protein RodA